MAKMVRPQEDLILEIKGQEEVITPSEYYFLSGSNKPVLLHATVVKLADKYGVHIEDVKLESDHWHNPKNFYFQCRAYGRLEDGTPVSEVGTANPLNLDGEIGLAQAGLMADKRAKDRLLIRLLGLTGKIYSEDEFDRIEFDGNENQVEEPAAEEPVKTKAAPKRAATAKTTKAKATSSATVTEKEQKEEPAEKADVAAAQQEGGQEDEEVSQEEAIAAARAMPVNYGKFKGKGVTLGEMMENYPEGFAWLLEADMSAPRMVELQKAARLLASVQA